MVSRDTGLVLPPCYHYNKTGEWLTLHMDTEDRGPRAKAQNNIYRLNSAETHVQLRKTNQNTRRGRRQQGRARPEPSLLQAGHGGPAALGGRGEARQSPWLLPAAARAQSRSGGTCHRRQHPGRLALLVAPHTGTGGEEGQHWHRPVSVSFLLTQKTSTKLREAAQLGLSPRVPAPTPSAPHSHLPPLKSALALPSSSRAARGPSLLP